MATTKDISSSPPLPRAPPIMPDGKVFVPWLTLPNELQIEVMRQLVPSSGPFTDYDSKPGSAARRADNEPWASRQALAQACLASRELETICRPLLYETVVLKDQRELPRLLRSLLRNSSLRVLVRRLGWGQHARLVNDNFRETEADVRELVAELISACDATNPNLAEVFQLRTEDPPGLSVRRALSMILAMLPKIQALSLSSRDFPLDFVNAGHDAVTHLLSPDLLSLRMLEDIIVDSCSTQPALWRLILYCPRVRRVWLKGPANLTQTADVTDKILWFIRPREWAGRRFPAPPYLPLLPWPVGGNVQELVLYRMQYAQWATLPKVFPNLERLVMVFQDGRWRGGSWLESRPGTAAAELSQDIGHAIALYKGSLRSLTVTGSLSNNGVTRRPDIGYTMNNPHAGYRWLIASIPPILSPGLPQVPLIELTTDCVMLFGRVDPSAAYQIASLLPSSLVSLHLIDYWAVPVDEKVVEHGETLGYYPMFPSGLAPLDFLGEVFAILYDSCATEHTRLRRITFSSPIFDDHGRWSTPATRPVDRADVPAWQARVADTFARIGVKFSFTTMRHLETSIKSSWARM